MEEIVTEEPVVVQQKTEEDNLRALKMAILSCLTEEKITETVLSLEANDMRPTTLLEIDRENVWITEEALYNMLNEEDIGEPGENHQRGITPLDPTKSIMEIIADRLPETMQVIHEIDPHSISIIVEKRPTKFTDLMHILLG
jgi:hypothetical protein